MMKVILNQHQKNCLVQGLRTAALSFSSDARVADGSDTMETFRRQADDALELATVIDGAASVELEVK